MTQLNDVVAWIASNASPGDLETIHGVMRQRRQTLAVVQAANLAPGQAVRTTSLSPKYLNGLEGVVEQSNARSAQRVDVRLDRESTLAIQGTKYGPSYAADVSNGFVLRGVPSNCLVIKEG